MMIVILRAWEQGSEGAEQGCLTINVRLMIRSKAVE